MKLNNKWEVGRQGTGYFKKLIIQNQFLFPFDLYLLYYPKGSYLPPHKDEIIDLTKKHYRLNIILKNSKKGGKFICDNLIFKTKRIKFFRPDINLHSLSPITEGERCVLSFGFLL